MVLEIYNKNMAVDELIGKASVDMRIKASSDGAWPLSRKRRAFDLDTGGAISCTISYDPNGVDANDENPGITLHVRVRRATGLQNVEYFGKQDPYVAISLTPADVYSASATRQPGDVPD